jgi:AbrB family looped-hinge helix DNA binding protein
MKIMEKGQVTIPKKYRERYGITRTTELDFVPTEEGLLLVKKTPRHSPLRQVYGLLNRPASADRLVEEIRGR